VSIDNLNGDTIDPFPFQLAVWQAVHGYLADGLPTRAAVFWRALQKYYALPQVADPRSYTLKYIIGS
jgi:elongation factor P hydroxylase